MNVEEQSKMDNNNEMIKDTASISKADVQDAATHKVVKRYLVGKVISNKADKTIIVGSERQVMHPLYKKYYKRTKKVMAHDEYNDCNIGDIVRVVESRPLSARKRWNLVKVIERAK